MKLPQELKYCKYCQNRNFDKDKGIICSFTNSKPSFKNVCQDFSKDNETVARIGERMIYESNYSLNLIEKFKDIFHIRVIPSLFGSTVIRYSKFKAVVYFIYLFGLLDFLLIYSIKTVPIDQLVIAIPSFTFMIGLFSFIIYLRFKDAFSKIPILEFNEKGLLVNNEFIKWPDFVGYKIYDEIIRTGRGNNRETYLELECIGREKREVIDVNQLNISKKNLLYLLNFYYSKRTK